MASKKNEKIPEAKRDNHSQAGLIVGVNPYCYSTWQYKKKAGDIYKLQKNGSRISHWMDWKQNESKSCIIPGQGTSHIWLLKQIHHDSVFMLNKLLGNNDGPKQWVTDLMQKPDNKCIRT